MASDWVLEFQKLLIEGYNSTERPMKKEIRRMMVAFLVCIDFSLVLWFGLHVRCALLLVFRRRSRSCPLLEGAVSVS